MKKRIINSGVIVAMILFVFTVFCYWKIDRETKNFVFNQVSELPHQKVGLLLGTSKLLKNGTPNQYFYNRIEAAVNLYTAKKIDYIIASGDNSSKTYNEPEDMKIALIERGIPEAKIVLDHAGFRTFDSVIRAKKIFGQTKMIIVSQKFHNQRAIYIAQKNGIEAYGYNAKDVKKYGGIKTKIREYFARTNLFLDQLFHKQPQYLGEKIAIE